MKGLNPKIALTFIDQEHMYKVKKDLQKRYLSVKICLMSFKLFSFFRGRDVKWRPVPHSVVRATSLAEQLHTEGYSVAELFNQEQILLLKDLYNETHNLSSSEGGMFYGMYSLDLNYRKHVHHKISEIIQPALDTLFKDYKNVVNFFISKLPGPQSELNIHQDMTSLDETLFSPLSIWIPLHDVNEENGALCVVPRSHFMFSPFRSISFQTPYGNLSDEIAQYLRPVYMKAGQALIFDPRILHHSLPNFSNSPRVAIVAGIFPSEAEIITCYKEPEPDAAIELLLQPDDFMFTNDNFFHNCTARPKTGKTIATVGKPMAPLSTKAFKEKCALLGIQPYEGQLPFLKQPCKMIGEPV